MDEQDKLLSRLVDKYMEEGFSRRDAEGKAFKEMQEESERYSDAQGKHESEAGV